MTTMEDATKKSIAASAGAFLTAFAVTPLEVVKTRIQVQTPNINVTPTESRLASHYCFSNGLMDTMLPKEQLIKRCICRPITYDFPSSKTPSVFRTMAKIAQVEGPMGLYAGLAPTLLISVPMTALYFTTYESLLLSAKEMFPNQNHGILAMTSGSLARGLAATIFSPLELVRVRMQAFTDSDSFANQLRKVLKAGPRELCSGLGATLARDIPFSAFYWYGIENSKEYLQDRLPIQDDGKKRITIAFASGISAGTFATIITHPFDLVKTRLQTAQYCPQHGTPMSTFQTLNQIARHEGLYGLFTGLIPRLGKVVPACAIMISTYETAKLYFHVS